MKIETLQFQLRKPAISDDIAQKLVAAETAMMLEDYELKRIYEHIDERGVGNGVGFAYQRYVLLGVLTLSHG